ncbi:mannan endo-1,4-beta-mannosidase [Gammaproteobacteria bacterium]
MITYFFRMPVYSRQIALFTFLVILEVFSTGDTLAAVRLAIPKDGVYTGAYIDFGETEDNVTSEAITNFESLVNKRLAIVAFSSYWGERSFPSKQVATIAAAGAIPLIFWSPWDSPYREYDGKPLSPPNPINLHSILAGKFDTYIDRWADAAKSHEGRPMLVAWGLEMNGQWFPWSGIFHGAGKHIQGKSGYLGPETYKRAYRYVVDRVRTRGATDIIWVFQTNGYSIPETPWNRMAEYYPGSDYVDWLGMSAYGKQFSYQDWATPVEAMDKPYQELIKVDPAKPVILAEWGVGEFPKSGSKAFYIRDTLQRITSHYSRIKAAIFWHERWQNQDETVSDLRVNSSQDALREYQRGIANALWLDRPEFH